MSDKVVNVYVGECFSDGAQVGGEGKSYGLTLTGNKLKLVENGQQSEVDLPAGGGSSNYDSEAFDTLMYMLAKAQYNPDNIYSSPAGQYTVTVTGNGDIDNPYYVNFVFIDKDLVGDKLSIGDVYNKDYNYITDNSTFTNIMSSPKNFFYGDTLVPYDKVTKQFDVSKLPKGIRAYRLRAENV
jgi:hypothetical protein